MKNNNYMCAVDLGSFSFKMAIAELNSNNMLELIHLEEIPSDGIKKGAIVNMEKVVTGLRLLVNNTIEHCGYNPREITLSYSSEYIEALNSSGVTAIGLRGKGRAITEEDKNNVINAVQAIVIGEDREIAHIVPLKYVVDNVDQVKEPLNIVAVRLEAEAHIVIAAGSLLNNITSAVKQAGLVLNEMVYSPLAASIAVLSNNERQRGTIFIDIGSATTKITFFQYGQPHFNAVLPLGGHSLTMDLAYMLQIDLSLAEEIKIKHGCSYLPLLERDDYAYLPGNAERGPEPVSEHYICDIVSARMTDIINGAIMIIEQKGWLAETSGVVVGGGGSNLPGVTELVAKIFNLPTHAALCGIGFDDLSEEYRQAQYASVLGLLKQNSFYSLQPLEKSLPVRHNEKSNQIVNKNRISSFFHSITKDFF